MPNCHTYQPGRYQINAVDTASSAAAEELTKQLPDCFRHRGDSHTVIAGDHVEELARCFQQIIASTIASLIDAGSERDVIEEDQKLNAALQRVVIEWSSASVDYPFA